MSAPFGGHPTFAQYLVWAKSQGCTIEQGVVHTRQGEAYSTTKIISPSGQWVIDVGTQHGEYLVPTTIARFDRRLGLTSPFFAIDDSGYVPAKDKPSDDSDN